MLTARVVSARSMGAAPGRGFSHPASWVLHLIACALLLVTTPEGWQLAFTVYVTVLGLAGAWVWSGRREYQDLT